MCASMHTKDAFLPECSLDLHYSPTVKKKLIYSRAAQFIKILSKSIII